MRKQKKKLKKMKISLSNLVPRVLSYSSEFRGASRKGPKNEVDSLLSRIRCQKKRSVRNVETSLHILNVLIFFKMVLRKAFSQFFCYS